MIEGVRLRVAIGARTSSGKPEPSLVATAAWLGLVIGLIEVGVLLLEKYQNRVATIGALRLNRHYPWMIPVAHVALFVAFGLALELFAKTRPDARPASVSSLVLGSLAILELLLTIRVLSTIACVLLGCGMASRLIPMLARYRPAFCEGRPGQPGPDGGGPDVAGDRPPCPVRLGEAPGGEAKPAAVGSPNVLFLVLDTVRAKSLSLYGYGRETSPRLDRLARSGVTFAQARSTAPWTLPSHAGMFTGRFPSELFQYHEQKLDASVPTLAGYLGRNGYATAGFVANTFYCNAGFGLSNGFDHYEDFDEISARLALRDPPQRRGGPSPDRPDRRRVGPPRSDGRKDADRINADFLEWLPTRGDRPFFAFLNYLDAHAPYSRPPAPTATSGSGRRPRTRSRTLARWQKKEYIPDDPRRDRAGPRRLRRLHRLPRRGPRPPLRRAGRPRPCSTNTLIIVTADHGEEIGEHRLVGHGRSLYRDELHVPLLVVKPGKVPSGRVVAEPVSLRDLPATVVDLLGLSGGSPFPGRSLAPLWTTSARLAQARARPGQVGGGDPPQVRRERSRPPALRGPMVSVVAEGMTYIRNADGARNSTACSTTPRGEGPRIRRRGPPPDRWSDSGPWPGRSGSP